MKKECTPRLALLNRRDLIGFALYAAGLVLALGAMSPSAMAQANGRWIANGDLTTPRVNHTATLLPTRQVLAVGGGDKTSDGIELVPVVNGCDFHAHLRDFTV